MTATFDALAVPRRRYLLAVLFERREPLSIETLATEVAVREHRAPIVTDDQVRVAHVELVHNHVPRLVEAGVLEEVDAEQRTVALAERPPFEADWAEYLLENPTGGPDCDEQHLNRTLEALRPTRRRTICEVLAERPDGRAVADLAAALAAREEDVRLVDVDESTRESVQSRLVHDDLPTLADVGLVAYDRSDGTVALETDATQWQAEWLPAELGRALAPDRNAPRDRPEAADVTDAGVCRSLEGRAAIVDRCCEIADDADDELFVTVPEPELLERSCLERWRAAADRGVDLYVGSRSPRVRDTVESMIPGATICEPQCDWLNFPVGRVHHGHVVFADRERVMLVTLGNESDEESRTTAITGDGQENALVRLVREHVGPRLDRLQSRRDDAPDEESTPLPL